MLHEALTNVCRSTSTPTIRSRRVKPVALNYWCNVKLAGVRQFCLQVKKALQRPNGSIEKISSLLIERRRCRAILKRAMSNTK